MASSYGRNMTVTTTTTTTLSPKGGGGGGEAAEPSPKGSGGHCLCSPTTHKGSFRCRFHRSVSSGGGGGGGAWFKRSESMKVATGNVEKANSLSPKSQESTI